MHETNPEVINHYLTFLWVMFIHCLGTEKSKEKKPDWVELFSIE